MMKTSDLLSALLENGFDHYFGVPDSLLSGLSTEIENNPNVVNHVITPNEGSAIAMAIGYNLASKKSPTVYMQNSGLGNALNPLISLAHKNVYAIPILLIIGWRGSPDLADEPQHVAQGSITYEMLRLAGIDTFIVDNNTEIIEIVKFLQKQLLKADAPYALLVQPNALVKNPIQNNQIKHTELSREDAIISIVNSLPKSAIVVATTGKLSRELNEYREQTNNAARDFLTVGGMGHASAIALAIAREKSDRLVVCLDGDGAFQMHLGTCALIGECSPANFFHVLINNGIHESVGSQKIASTSINYKLLTSSFNYRSYELLRTKNQIIERVPQICRDKGPIFVEIVVNSMARPNISRPKSSPIENKTSFQNHVFHQTIGQ